MSLPESRRASLANHQNDVVEAESGGGQTQRLPAQPRPNLFGCLSLSSIVERLRAVSHLPFPELVSARPLPPVCTFDATRPRLYRSHCLHFGLYIYIPAQRMNLPGRSASQGPRVCLKCQCGTRIQGIAGHSGAFCASVTCPITLYVVLLSKR